MEDSPLELVCKETLESLEESLDGERSLCCSFVKRYVSMWPGRFKRIRDAIIEDHNDEAMDAALSLRSASVMVGACRLGDLTTGIIRLIEGGHIGAVGKLLTTLKLYGDQTMHQLKISYIDKEWPNPHASR